MRRILFDSPRAGKRFLLAFSSLSLGLAGLGCGPKAENTSIEIGGGMRKGSPPMCYQYRAESRATMRAYDIFLHVNNTCSYVVDCMIYDDVTEQTRQIVEPPFQAESLVLAQEVQSKRVDLKVECTWKP